MDQRSSNIVGLVAYKRVEGVKLSKVPKLCVFPKSSTAVPVVNIVTASSSSDREMKLSISSKSVWIISAARSAGVRVAKGFSPAQRWVMVSTSSSLAAPVIGGLTTSVLKPARDRIGTD